MRIKLSFLKAFLISLVTTIGLLIYVFANPKLNSGYAGLFFLSISPAVLTGIIGYCYLIKLLDKLNILAPHFIFRYLVPFSVISLAIWIAINCGDDPYIEAYQQDNFQDYFSYFFDFALSVLLPLAITLAAITAM
ncbi:MAG: hypothetical protein EOO96_25830, partial [Pedobacter sp.]